MEEPKSLCWKEKDFGPSIYCTKVCKYAQVCEEGQKLKQTNAKKNNKLDKQKQV